MTDGKHKKDKKKDNFIKKTSSEANKFFGHTVDTSGKVIKSVSGEGGLVGKAVDSSSEILKGASGTANDIVGKSSEVPGRFYKGGSGQKNKRNRNHRDDEDHRENDKD